ncbi:MAG: Glycerate dehydrogenase [Verrucomicrobia subdivision 3 bacterium]|nr:Glycerate dehydrogenase [Limisphaerales bacterium]MCS1417362.1 Glycerate dehydrogenase [Limisphaerales bacterium]
MSKRIVVLDGYTLNPGDLSWSGLQALGDCTIFERTPPSQVIPRAAGAEIILTNKTPIDRAMIHHGLPDLQYIGVLATGFNIVDTQSARERRIPVTNVPAYGVQSVAQMTFAHILELTQRVGHHAASVREGEWNRCLDFCYWEHPLIELEDATIGIVGYGRIGQAVARLAQAFGMRVMAVRSSEEPGVGDGVEFAALEEVLKQSDVISLHCPLTEDTQHLINAERLKLMKATAFMVNTSRGPLVDEAALASALNEGRLAGAGVDVLEVEPPRSQSPLYTAKNCYVTPHIAWATRAARKRLMRIAVENIQNFVNGAPTNVVN